MEIEVYSFIKVEDSFFSVEDFGRHVPDPYYIEGAIELTVHGKPLLTKEMWDLVDQLWFYIVDGLVEVVDGGSFSTYFPDQPTLLSIDNLHNSKLRISVKKGHLIQETIVEERNLLLCLVDAASTFFNYLSLYNPSDADSYDTEKGKLQYIKVKAGLS